MENTLAAPKMKHSGLTGLTLILSAFMCSADSMTLQPSIDLMASTVFSEYSYGTVSMIMTISNIAMFIIAIATALLLKVGKKRLLIIGSICFTVGGFIGYFITNLPLLLVTRFIEGFGAGLVLTVSMILIPELFKEQAVINKWMGLNGVMMALTAAIVGFTSGMMAMTSWKLPFFWYLAGIIILIMQLAFIPNDKADGAAAEGEGKIKIDKAGIGHGVFTFLYSLFGAMFFVGISGVVMENGIGSADMAGTATTFNTIGSFVFGFAFAVIMNKTKAYAPVIFYVLEIAALVILMNAHSIVTCCIGAFIYGMGYQNLTSYVFGKVSTFSTPESEAGNMAFTNAMYYLAMFVNSFFITAIMTIGKTDSLVFVMKVQIVCVVIMTIWVLIQAIVNKGEFTRAPKETV